QRQSLRAARPARPQGDQGRGGKANRAFLHPGRRTEPGGRYAVGRQHAEGGGGARTGRTTETAAGEPADPRRRPGRHAIHLADHYRCTGRRCGRTAVLGRSLRTDGAVGPPAGVLSRPHRRGLHQPSRPQSGDAGYLHAGPQDAVGRGYAGGADMSAGASLGRQSRWVMIRRETGSALFAAVAALVVAFVVILFTSKVPLDAFNVLLTAPISRVRTVGLWIDDAVKLTITGLAFSLVFQARQFS